MFDSLSNLQCNGSYVFLGAGCMAGPHLANLTFSPILSRLTPPETWHPKVPGPSTCPSLPGCLPVPWHCLAWDAFTAASCKSKLCPPPSQANSGSFLCYKNVLGCLAHIPTLSSKGLWYFSLTLILGLCNTESNSGTQRKYAVYKPVISPKLQGFFVFV